MHAQLTIVTKKDLPSNKNLRNSIIATFGRPTNKKEVIRETEYRSYRNNRSFLKKVVCAYLRENDYIFFVKNPDRWTIKIHIESAVSKTGIKELHRCVNEVTIRMIRHLKTYNNKQDNVIYKTLRLLNLLGQGPKDVGIQILVEGNGFQTGKVRSWFGKVADSFTSGNLWAKYAYLPAATVLASSLMDFEPEKAIFNAVVALIFLVIWSIIEATFNRDKINYKEV